MTGYAFGPVDQVADADGVLRLAGRVLVGSIKVGDEFTVIETDTEDLPCRLQVTRIVIFGAEVREIEAAMTPSIEVIQVEPLHNALGGTVLRGSGAARTTLFDP